MGNVIALVWEGLPGEAQLAISSCALLVLAVRAWYWLVKPIRLLRGLGDGGTKGSVRRQIERQELINRAEISLNELTGPLSRRYAKEAARKSARYVARCATGRYVPFQLYQVAALGVLLFLTLLVVAAGSVDAVDGVVQFLLNVCAGLLLLWMVLILVLMVGNSASVAMLDSKCRAICARRKIRKFCSNANIPKLHAGSLARKTVETLVTSSACWCLVRAESERGPLGTKFVGSIEASDLMGNLATSVPTDARLFVYSDYGLSSARKTRELLEKGYCAYNIGAVFDERVLWERLAIEIDILQELELIPLRILGES